MRSHASQVRSTAALCVCYEVSHRSAESIMIESEPGSRHAQETVPFQIDVILNNIDLEWNRFFYLIHEIK